MQPNIQPFLNRPGPNTASASKYVAPLLLLGIVALLGTAYLVSIPFRQAMTYGVGLVAPSPADDDAAKPAAMQPASANPARNTVTVVFKQSHSGPNLANQPKPKPAITPATKPIMPKPVAVPETLQQAAKAKTPAPPPKQPAVKPQPQPPQQAVSTAMVSSPAQVTAKPAPVVPPVQLKPSVATVPLKPAMPEKTVVIPAAHTVARIAPAILNGAPKRSDGIPSRPSARPAALPSMQPTAKTQGETFSDCAGCPELVAVVALPEEGLVRLASTGKPARQIKPFAIGAREVTFDEWDRCVAEGGCTRRPSDGGWGRGQRPVINVSFDEINSQYLPWLSRRSKQRYRLPAEAEWEIAVRGASDRLDLAYSFGNDAALLCDYGNASDTSADAACQDGFPATAPVASFKPNALGLFDMHGNVWEWVSDCLRTGFSKDPAKNPEDCRFRVLRGGSWASGADALRSSERGWEKPYKEKNSIGFRVARSLP